MHAFADTAAPSARPMIDRASVPPLSAPAEILLMALVSSACPLLQVDFGAESFASLLGWRPREARRAFEEIRRADLLSPVPEVPGRSQIVQPVREWVRERAEREIPPPHLPDEVRDAAQLLLLVRLYG